MKKLLGILVLGLLWCNVGFAYNGLRGINQFELVVRTDEKCGVTKSKLETAALYIFSNSKIKIVDASSDVIFIDVAIMETNHGCFSSHRVEVYNYKNANNSAGYKVFTPQMLFSTGIIRKGPPDTYGSESIRATENQLKELVVEWSKVNN